MPERDPSDRASPIEFGTARPATAQADGGSLATATGADTTPPAPLFTECDMASKKNPHKYASKIKFDRGKFDDPAAAPKPAKKAPAPKKEPVDGGNDN